MTRRAPAELLGIERAHRIPSPEAPYTAALNSESRSVGWSATVSFRGARYLVPHTLADATTRMRSVAANDR